MFQYQAVLTLHRDGKHVWSSGPAEASYNKSSLQLSLTNQALLNSNQNNQSVMRNSRLVEEVIVPVSIKDFASEHFR